MVIAIKIQINLCFYVAKNKVTVEDNLDMHNVDNTLNAEVMYNARIFCYYIAWDLKICMDHLNGVNNDFTWMKFFIQGCHNMSEAIINKIINGETVKKMACLV